MCPHPHCERKTKLSFGRGPGLDPLKGPGSSRVVLIMLSRATGYLSLIFKHSDIKKLEKKTNNHS